MLLSPGPVTSTGAAGSTALNDPSQHAPNVLEMVEGLRAQYPPPSQIEREIDQLIANHDPRSKEALWIAFRYEGLARVRAWSDGLDDLVSDIGKAALATRDAFTYPQGNQAADVGKISRQMFVEQHADKMKSTLVALQELYGAAVTERDRINELRDGKRDTALQTIFAELDGASILKIWGYKQVATVLCYWRIEGWRGAPQTHIETCRSAFNRWQAMQSKR